MPITGSGNNFSLSMSGNTTYANAASLGSFPVQVVAPTNYSNLLETFHSVSGQETQYIRVAVASRELNTISEDPSNFGGFNDISSKALILALEPSGGSFPATQAYAKTRVSSNQTSHNVLLPYGTQVGDFLLVIMESTVTDVNTPSGWTKPHSMSNFYFYYKVADGNEGNVVTFSSSLGTSETIALRISGAQSLESNFANTTDPPSLTPSWGANNTLWLAAKGGTPILDTAFINGPQGTIYGYYKWINEGVGGNAFFYADQRMSPYRDRNYFTAASSPNALVFPNTSLSINDFYYTSPIDEWTIVLGDGSGGGDK